jgi:hypothetical protein
MNDNGYTAWRVAYQSSEQAARAAYAEMMRLRAENQKLQEQRNEKID